MESDLAQKFETLEKKIDAAYESAEKTRKYFLVFLILSTIGFLLPIIGLLFAVPAFLSVYGELMML